jgi:hypothetical protein
MSQYNFYVDAQYRPSLKCNIVCNGIVYVPNTDYVVTDGVTITFDKVSNAIGYRVYTAEMIAKLKRARVRAKRKALNKSKRQARARTGRRRG